MTLEIPIGQRCKCGKVHLIKPMEELEKLSPRERAQAYKSEHRCFRDGYYCSLDKDKDSEIWEFYLPLSKLKMEMITEQEEKQKEPSAIDKYVQELYEVEDEEDF